MRAVQEYFGASTPSPPSTLLDAVGNEKGNKRKSILEIPAYYHVPRRERESREHTSRGKPRKIVLWAAGNSPVGSRPSPVGQRASAQCAAWRWR